MAARFMATLMEMMMTPYELFLKSSILVLLPMIPAIIIFKIFPTSNTTGDGLFAGIRWKLSGAFAAYIFVTLYLFFAVKANTDLPDTEVWTVRGKVDAKDIPNINANILTIRSQPQDIDIAADGSFTLKILVRRTGKYLIFPRITFDMTGSCFGAKTLALDGKTETFEAVAQDTKPDIKRIDNDRTIDFGSPVILERFSTNAGPCSS
jgi:hypothetical protein